MKQLINLKPTSEVLKVAVAEFTAHEAVIASHIEAIDNLPPITDKETRDKTHKTLSDANRALGDYKKLRLNTTRPLDDLKKTVMAHADEKRLPLEKLINEFSGHVQAYDAEQERKRLEELARIEAERKAREESERKERERKERLQRLVMESETRGMNALSQVETPDQLNELIEKFKSVEYEKFEEYADELKAKMQTLIKSAEAKRDHIEEMARLKEEQKKAEREKSEAARLLAEQKQKQLEEQRKIQEESARLERQRIENDRKKRELVEEAKRQEEEAARLKEEETKRKELQAQRAKGISSGIEGIEVIDISIVPAHLYEVKFKMNEVKKALKDGDIPGVNITLKTGLRLNG